MGTLTHFWVRGAAPRVERSVTIAVVGTRSGGFRHSRRVRLRTAHYIALHDHLQHAFGNLSKKIRITVLRGKLGKK
jgi:hypothetical protein